MTDKKSNENKLNHLIELLVDLGDILKFDNFQEFVDGRKSYGDNWCYRWPKNPICDNCQEQFELYPEGLNGAYISNGPFAAKSMYHAYPAHLVHLVVIIECPNCKTYFKYVSD